MNHSGTRPNGGSSTAGEAIARVSPDKDTRKWRLPFKEVTRFFELALRIVRCLQPLDRVLNGLLCYDQGR